MVKAIVQKIVMDGKHGPFVVAICDKSGTYDGSITFSLDSFVWQEKHHPKEGECVFLSDIIQKRAGWRAETARYWTSSDEEKQQRAKSKTNPTFIYPTADVFPFDGVCGCIIRELEKRNWKVPGISVEFDVYGTGDTKYRLVREVSGNEFQIYFCRVQGRLGRFYDTAAVTRLNIPRMELHVYEDYSGPRLYTYVGDNWPLDREKFVNAAKVNSKLRKEPRMYLQYTGGWRKPGKSGMQYTRQGLCAPFLVHTNDLGRQYDPRGNEPTFFITKDVFETFEKWISENVLKHILSEPIPKESVDIFPPEKPIYFPTALGELFTFCEYDKYERIQKGKANVQFLEPEDRYALSGGGWRLLSLDIKNDGTVPEVAYEGFLWCGFKMLEHITENTNVESLEIPGAHVSLRETYLVRIMPNRANHIYIADIGAGDAFKEKIIEKEPKRERYTNEEVQEFMRMIGRTIIPVGQYKYDFKKPVILINRELSFDEVEIISGPHK
jgi:hypothetical protein